MTVWGALAGGAIGTIVLSGGLRFGQEVGVTRMDIPLLLGTMFSQDRRRASLIGFGVHFTNGLLFSLAYFAVFEAVGRAGWLLGLGLGFAHAILAGGSLITIVLPSVHPRMGSAWSDADETPILEPPGFMLMNYGRQTALVTLVLHLAYGAIVGGFAARL